MVDDTRIIEIDIAVHKRIVSARKNFAPSPPTTAAGRRLPLGSWLARSMAPSAKKNVPRCAPAGTDVTVRCGLSETACSPSPAPCRRAEPRLIPELGLKTMPRIHHATPHQDRYRRSLALDGVPAQVMGSAPDTGAPPLSRPLSPHPRPRVSVDSSDSSAEENGRKGSQWSVLLRSTESSRHDVTACASGKIVLSHTRHRVGSGLPVVLRSKSAIPASFNTVSNSDIRGTREAILQRSPKSLRRVRNVRIISLTNLARLAGWVVPLRSGWSLTARTVVIVSCRACVLVSVVIWGRIGRHFSWERPTAELNVSKPARVGLGLMSNYHWVSWPRPDGRRRARPSRCASGSKLGGTNHRTSQPPSQRRQNDTHLADVKRLVGGQIYCDPQIR